MDGHYTIFIIAAYSVAFISLGMVTLTSIISYSKAKRQLTSLQSEHAS